MYRGFSPSQVVGPVQEPKSQDHLLIDEKHFVETTWGSTSSEFFTFQGNQEFIVVGQEDGSLHVYDYTRFKTTNYKKLIFNVKNSSELDQSIERFCESNYSHCDTIVSIQKNPANERIFLTASKDGWLKIWTFIANNGEQITKNEQDQILAPKVTQDTVIELIHEVSPQELMEGSISSKSSPITSALWLDESTIVISTKNGKVLTKKIKDASQSYKEVCLENANKDPCKLILSKKATPVWNLATSSTGSIFAACDSGEVVELNERGV